MEDLNILYDIPIEIIVYILEFLKYKDILKLLFTNKDFYEIVQNFSLNDNNDNGLNLYVHQKMALFRIFKHIPKHPYYINDENDNLLEFTPSTINIMAILGFGKTRLGLASALEYIDNYQVLIMIPNIKILNVWIAELNKLNLYNPDPNKCDFVIASKTRIHHYKYWERNINIMNAMSNKIILSPCKTINVVMSSKPILLIMDESHKTSYKRLIDSSCCSKILLSATELDNKKIQSYRYFKPNNKITCTYNIISKFSNDILQKIEQCNNPIIITDKSTLKEFKQKYKNRFNIWSGEGTTLLKCYENTNKISVIGTDVVEGVNFNKTNIIVFYCSLNNIRPGRVMQLLGRVIRYSNISNNYKILHIAHKSRKDIIKIKIALYIMMNNIQCNDFKLYSSSRIDKIINVIKNMGFNTNNITDKELIWLFSDIELEWDFENFENESVLGMKNLLNLGFIKSI